VNRAELEKRLDRLARRRPAPADLEGAARGAAELQRLGIDLGKLSNAELGRLEMLAGTWPDDGTMVPAAAIWACLGRG
jgi:hypothetical protein